MTADPFLECCLADGTVVKDSNGILWWAGWLGRNRQRVHLIWRPDV